MVRFFDNNEGFISEVKPGTSIVLNSDEMSITPIITNVGTPTTIRLSITNESKMILKDIIDLTYKYTQYSPHLIKNETKLPFPLHYAQNTLTKTVRFNYKTFSFETPFFM